MSTILNRIYVTLDEFFIANKMHYKIQSFENLGDRILNHDLTNIRIDNYDFNTLQYDPWFFQRPTILLHDQEPMMYNDQKENWDRFIFKTNDFDDRLLILTSEKNSKELDDFCKWSGAVPCYWFSNAALAIEWYQNGRWNLRNEIPYEKPRLRYKISCINRLIDQQRIYRPILSRLLMETVDNKYLRLSCNLTDPISNKPITDLDIPKRYMGLFKGVDTSSPLLVNVPLDDLTPTGEIINQSYNLSRTYFSRVFCHIVTETLFMDDTLHLTEKTFRPLVLQRPFLMVGPPGSLELLRSYGFRTFDEFWNEGYDTISDPWQRLDAVLDIVKQITNMSLDDLESMLGKMQHILKHNFDHFYGEFPNIVYKELVDNLRTSIAKQRSKKPKGWMIQRIESLSEGKLQELITSPISDEISDVTLYDGFKANDFRMIDQNLARFLSHHMGVPKDASKEQILASIYSSID